MLPKTLKPLSFIAALALTAPAVCAEASSLTPPSPVEITERVRQLGDDDYDTREAAQDRLLEIGAPAAAEIECACTSKDPEVSIRARRIRPHLWIPAYLRRLRSFLRKDFCWEADIKDESPSLAVAGHIKAKGSSFAFEGTLRIDEKGNVQPLRAVSDGQTIWFESSSPSILAGGAIEKTIMKVSLQELEIQNLWPFLFEKMLEGFDLTRTAEDKVDGVAVFVMEGKVKAPGEAPDEPRASGKVRIQIPKEKATFLQWESFNEKNERDSEMKITQIKTVNPPGEKDFVYKPPEGVNVMDVTSLFKK